jgi:signal transduction histidine kinase
MTELEKRSLAECMEAMQRLTAGFAHELRNPLNAARLQLQLVDREISSSNDPTALALVELQSMADLIDEFLLFAHPAALEAEDYDIAALVAHAVERERAFADRRRVDLSVVAPTTSGTVDAPKIVFVVEELLHNAIEAVAERGHVAIELVAQTDAIHILVRDDGPGIPDELARRIYEPFFSTHDGRGLGLAIVHTFVGLHGGDIEHASNDQGTCFEVTLPRIS